MSASDNDSLPTVVVPSPTLKAACSPAAIATLYIAALAGRFTLSRAGVDVDPWLDDARIWLCAPAVAAAVGWRYSRTHGPTPRRWTPAARALACLLALYTLSAGWSVPPARLADRLTDLAALGILLACAATVSAVDGERAAQLMLRLAWGAGLVYACAGIVAGGGDQGRYAALGGGPNVFVRVVAVGVLAAVALALSARPGCRWWWLAPVPLLILAAVLSGSRGGVAALAATAVLVLPVAARGRLSVGALVGACAAMALAGCITWRLAGERAADVTARYGVTALEGNGYSNRPDLLARAQAIFAEHPIAGGGLDAYWARGGWLINMGYPHNIVANIAVDVGLLGLTAAAAAVWLFWRAGRPWHRMPLERLGCAAAAVYILLASQFSGDLYDTRMAWIFAVFAVNRARRHPPEEPCLPPSPKLRPGRHRVPR